MKSRPWIIIGSTAASHWFPEWRAPKDLDLLCSAKIKSDNFSTLYIDTQWHDLAQELIDTSANKVFLDADLLFTLKLSHSYWDIHWDKTIHDVLKFQELGCQVNQELHDRLVQMWSMIHGKKLVNLNQSKETFWNDAVVRKMNHEDLHRIVALHSHPLHESVRLPGNDVLVSKDLFLKLPEELQLDLLLEEILVTAIERFQLTSKSTKGERLSAMKKAHFKMCTSMSKGWFAQFAVLSTKKLLVDQKTRWYNHLNSVLLLLEKS